MYDRRLEAVVAVSEEGSFSRAAARLCISPTALIKQVTTLEAEYGIKLFERGRRGTSCTAAGAEFVEDARAYMRQGRDIVNRARRGCSAERDGETVRLGVSVLSPGKKVLDTWPMVCEQDASLRLELVSIGSIYAPGS